MRVEQCRSCRAPLLWAVTTAGAKMPLDANPVIRAGEPAGLYVLVKATTDGAPLAVAVSAVSGLAGIEQAATYLTHYATCPDAGRYRRRKPAAEAAG